jgi:type IV pilus assembly protein PilY1
MLYAFDVSVPTAPKFMWKVTPASAGLSLLGQTWSEPRVARLKGIDDPVLVFGGGYDASAEDSGGTTTMGNAVFVLNARTGAVLRAFTSLDAADSAQSIQRSVAADVTLVDVDHDRLVDRAYAADLGGQVYRIDFEGEGGATLAADKWTIHKIADLSGGTSTGRKFFYAPDVIPTKDFVAVMIGSGDREKPLLSATQDHFFQVFDQRVSKGAPSSAAPVLWSGLTEMTQQPNLSSNGCYMALAQGEKVVNAATSIGGRSYFGTNRPSTGSSMSCSANLGVAKTYEMPLFCVAATGQVVAGGGLPPSPVSGIVNVKKADGTVVQVPFIIGGPNPRGSAIEGSRVQQDITSPRMRRYWFQETRR